MKLISFLIKSEKVQRQTKKIELLRQSSVLYHQIIKSGDVGTDGESNLQDLVLLPPVDDLIHPEVFWEFLVKTKEYSNRGF